jgi:2Fe-2S ferredoxin
MRIVFIDHRGAQHIVEGEIGQTLMRCAANNLVPGILGECGGSIACGTCHGYLADEWFATLPPATRQEQDMLAECIDRRHNSRLTCQIAVTNDMDGLTIVVPEKQV